MESTPRPNPVQDALRRVGPAVAGAVGLFSGVATLFGFSQAQIAAVQAYGQTVTDAAAPTSPIALAAAAVVTLVTGGVSLFGTLKAGKGATDDTTPTRSPRDVDGTALVRVDGLPLGGNPNGDGLTIGGTAGEHAYR